MRQRDNETKQLSQCLACLCRLWRAGLVEGSLSQCLACLSRLFVGGRADRREFIPMSGLSRLFFWVSGRKGVRLGAAACSWIFSSVMSFFLLCGSSLVRLADIFAVTFGLNVFFGFKFLAQGTPALRILCRPNPVAPLLSESAVHSNLLRRRIVVRAERRPSSSSSEPSVLPSSVRALHPRRVVAAPASSWAGDCF